MDISPDTIGRFENVGQSWCRKRRTMATKFGRRRFLGMGAAAAAGAGLWSHLEAHPQNVNGNSIASDLKIPDRRTAVLRGPGVKPIQEGNGGPSSSGGLGPPSGMGH